MGLALCESASGVAVILYRTVSLSSVFSATLPEGARIVILGTGGTIAGEADDAGRPWSYQAARLAIGRLVRGVVALAPLAAHLHCEQVAQVDSKDMGWPVWRDLAHALARHLADPAVMGVVIPHGSDTLEETAALLHWLVPHGKPIVLTAAMRPATAADADGPRNLADAVATVLRAHHQGQSGVVATLAGRVWSARDVRKAHSHAIDAFDGGGAEALWCGDVPLDSGLDEPPMAAWPKGPGLGLAVVDRVPARVPLVTSHAGVDGEGVRAWLRPGGPQPQGILVACTGHGTVHADLEAALKEAQSLGVVIWRSTRVARGGVCSRDGDLWPATGHWTAAQARLGLQLHLMGAPLRLDLP
jgi:L-asparaginase